VKEQGWGWGGGGGAAHSRTFRGSFGWQGGWTRRGPQSPLPVGAGKAKKFRGRAGKIEPASHFLREQEKKRKTERTTPLTTAVKRGKGLFPGAEGYDGRGGGLLRI